jgi:hypothetical protein
LPLALCRLNSAWNSPAGIRIVSRVSKTIWRSSLKWVAWLAGGALALAVAAYLALLAINWRDRPPSEEALQLAAVFRDRPSVADADNGFVYAMGFHVRPNEDPHAAGLRRIEWLRHVPEDPYVSLTPDPIDDGFDIKAGRSPAAQRLADACGLDMNQCAAALDGADAIVGEWLKSEEWLLNRYRALLNHSGWIEPLPLDLRAPLPAYSGVFDGQKLLLARAWLLAGQKDAPGVRDLLAQDVRFWRQVLESADSVLTKMIAIAGLKRHFAFGNLALRRLPAERAMEGLPQEWTKEITSAERSMIRSLAGEWMFFDGVSRQTKAHGRWDDVVKDEGRADDEGVIRKLLWIAAEPLYQPRDSANRWAGQLVRLARELDAPYAQYRDALERAKAIFTEEREPPLSRLYNLLGGVMYWTGSVDYSSYGARVSDIEGVRLAAFLTAELRSRKITTARMPGQLIASPVRVPYTGEPFTWDAAEEAVVFTGLEPAERARYRFAY